ncbi:MAG: hypothetical protein KJ571_05360 [Bacteroidetes bacterium]|nr:hypothetical protein [Bacteroidota bacterium]
MKKIIFLTIIAGLVFFGCSKNSDLNPLASNSESTIITEDASPFISLPVRDNNSLAKILNTREKWITPWGSERIILEDNYWSGKSFIRVKMELIFPKGSVDRFIKASAHMDTEAAAFNFYPSPMTFNIPVILNFEISGLTGEDLERFKEVKAFVYISPTGELETMSYDKLGVEENSFWGKKTGKFVLENCKIPHFSRFGFVR